jgi:hypothetical protein
VVRCRNAGCVRERAAAELGDRWEDIWSTSAFGRDSKAELVLGSVPSMKLLATGDPTGVTSSHSHDLSDRSSSPGGSDRGGATLNFAFGVSGWEGGPGCATCSGWRRGGFLGIGMVLLGLLSGGNVGRDLFDATNRGCGRIPDLSGAVSGTIDGGGGGRGGRLDNFLLLAYGSLGDWCSAVSLFRPGLRGVCKG